MKSFVNQLDFDVFLGAQVLLDFLLGFVPHIVFNTKVKTEFFIFFVDIVGQAVHFDIFEFF